MIEFTSCGDACFDRKPDIFPIACRYFIYDGAPSLSTQTATIEQLAHYITSGHPWYPMVFAASTITVSKQNFSRASLLAFDLEKGEHSEEKLERVLKKTGLRPCLIYRTYNWSEAAHRNRIVFQLPKAEINPVKYLLYGVFFWAIYKDIDTSCIDTARLFYGTKDQHYTVDEAAILNLEELVKNGIAAIKEAKDRTPGFYQQIIRKLTSPAMNIKIGEDGLPCVRVQGDNVIVETNTEAKRILLEKEKNNEAINDEILKSNKPIHKITIVNWFAKVTTEPLFSCLFRGRDKIGYLRAVVLASNLRFIDSEDLKKIFFQLLYENYERIEEDPNHVIEECKKIWNLPEQANSGYGCHPLPYSACGEADFEGYAYPLSYIRNYKITKELNTSIRAIDALSKRFSEFDFENNPKGLVINGTCSIGKTYSFLANDNGKFYFKNAIEEITGRPQKIAFLCSRTVAREQNLSHYTDTFRYISADRQELESGKIYCATYHTFIEKVKAGIIKPDTFDIIIADECQSLFKDSTFSEQMGLFLNWQNDFKGKIIWLTANSNQFTQYYTRYTQIQNLPRVLFDELYKDNEKNLTRNITSKVIYCDTSNVDYYVEKAFNKACPQHRVLVFLSDSKKCFSWWNYARNIGIRAAFLVSQNCSREIDLKEKKDLNPDVEEYLLSRGETNIKIIDLLRTLEAARENNHLQTVQNALMVNENYPPDIDILFTTSVLREGINIQADSNVKTLITDSFDEISILQERGRIRADIEEFIIAPNKRGVKRTIENTLKDFKEVLPMSQIEMAQKYGEYIQRKKLKSDAPPTVLSPMKDYFIPNYAAIVYLEAQKEEFEMLKKLNDEQKKEKFGSVFGEETEFVKTVGKEERKKDQMAELRKLFEEYQGVPLIDRYAAEIIERVGKIIEEEDFTIKKVCNLVKECGMGIQQKQITKKQIREYGLKEEDYKKTYRFITL